MGTWYWRSWKTLSVVLSFSSCVSFSWIEFTCSCHRVSNRSACQQLVSMPAIGQHVSQRSAVSTRATAVSSPSASPSAASSSPLLRFMVEGFAGDRLQRGFRVSGSGLQVPGFGFRVSGSGFRVPGSGFRVPRFGFWVSGSGIGVSCSVFRDPGSVLCMPSFG